ncbi:MAG TPA: DUF2652 domain-containing protein [Candidatus Binatia bacterium]|nr:DUF2652 domain-containing protein [Candidatus Binatia bacterium]
MLARPEPACLVIADISGYTSYLAGVELDHAQDILADLMTTVVGALRPSFRLAKLEGDAAFTWAPVAAIDASLLLDTIEGTYFAFRRRLRDVQQASTCECNACIRMPSLDLKLIAHHGVLARQRVLGRDELAGPDVILAHRLLKNDVEARLGLRAYALYTEACIRAMALADPTAAGLLPHEETIEHIGPVRAWVRDLAAAWREEQERTRVLVGPDDAYGSIEVVLPGPPSLVWEFFTAPSRRVQWQEGVTAVQEEAPTGRRGRGTKTHCVHGRDAILEEILDWRPYEYWTVRALMPMPGAPKITMSDVFEPVGPNATRLTTRVARPRTARERAFLDDFGPILEAWAQAGIDRLRPLLEAELAGRAAGPGADAEPDLPASTARHLREPIRAGDPGLGPA